MKSFLKKTEGGIGRVTRAAASCCLLIVFVLYLFNIFTRFFPIVNPIWIDETIQFFLVWMIFLAAMEAVRTGEHFLVDIITDKVQGRFLGKIFRLLSVLITLFTFALICWFGFNLCARSTSVMYTLKFMKQSYFYFCIPLSAIFMCAYTARDLFTAITDFLPAGARRKQNEV